MKFIFLDVDGVLNSERTTALSPNGYIGISSSLVKKLAKIVKATDAKIILSSTWKRSEDEDFKYLARKLMQQELYMSGKTHEPNNALWHRGLGIKEYLNNHECDAYVIIDDELFDFQEEGLLEHAVITNATQGLTNSDVEKAIGVLNGKLVDPNDYKDVYVWGYHH